MDMDMGMDMDMDIKMDINMEASKQISNNFSTVEAMWLGGGRLQAVTPNTQTLTYS